MATVKCEIRNMAKIIIPKITPAPLLLLTRFLIKNGYVPNLVNPKKFNEKVICKMLFDRDVRLTRIADKLAARGYIEHTVGSRYIPGVYAIWDDADRIVVDRSWGPFVLKANHGSAFLMLVENPATVDVIKLRRAARDWLAINYGRQTKEWCYVSIPPKIFAEKWIGSPAAKLVDYKFFCFSGEPKFLKIIKGMNSTPHSAYCDLKLNRLPVTDGLDQKPLDVENLQEPPNFPEMIRIAATLSSSFDFLRVDLYNVDGEIFVGELTNYPLGAAVALSPAAGDELLGSFWDVSRMSYLPKNKVRSLLRL